MIRSATSTVATMCFALTGLIAPARGALTAFWRHNPITPEAIADDPALAGMQSWSVMVSMTDTNARWTSAGARLTLPSGHFFYRNALGGLFRPSLLQQTMNPASTFHTYVTQPQQLDSGSHPPSILGGFPDTATGFSFGGTLDPIPGTFAVAWGDPAQLVHPPGSYEIVRFTFPQGVLPAVDPQSRTTQALPDQTVPIPTTIPEATGSALVVAALIIWTSRARAEHAVDQFLDQ